MKKPVIRLATEIAKWTPGDLNATFSLPVVRINDTAFKTV